MKSEPIIAAAVLTALAAGCNFTTDFGSEIPFGQPSLRDVGGEPDPSDSGRDGEVRDARSGTDVTSPDGGDAAGDTTDAVPDASVSCRDDDECRREEVIDCDALGMGGAVATCGSTCTWDLSDCYACTVYVDGAATVGGSGMSAQDPLPAESSVFEVVLGTEEPGALRPGETLCLKRGTVLNPDFPIWFGTVGADGNPVRLGAYGPTSDPLPVHHAFDPLGLADFSALGDGRSTAAYARGSVVRVWWHDTPLTWASDSTLSDGDWAFDAGELYVRPPPTARGGDVVRVIHPGGLVVDASDAVADRFVEIRDQRFEYVGDALLVYGNTLVHGCEFVRTNQAMEARSSSNLIVRDSTFRDVEGAIIVLGPATNVVIQRNDIQGTYGTNFPSAVALWEVSSSVVEGNFILGGPGAVARGTAGIILNAPLGDLEIARNFISGFERGIRTRIFTSTMYGNLDIHHNILHANQRALDLPHQSTTGATIIANNTIFGATEGIATQLDPGFRIVNNLVTLDSPDRTFIDYHGPSYGRSIQIDYNGYVPSSGLFEFVDEDVFHTFSDWRGAFPDFDTNSIASDSNPFVGIPSSSPTAFQLIAGAAVIGAGIDVGYATDFGGRPIDPDFVDIGAWQSQ